MSGYQSFRHTHLTLPQRQKLRKLEIEFKIKDTATLVSAYNETSGAHEHHDELLLWINHYIPFFEKGSISECCHEAMEFAKLANIIPKGPSETRLLQDACSALSRKIHWGDYGEEDLILSVSYFLLSVDSKAFQGNAHHLARLADELMSKLGPRATFSRGTYPTHSVSLFALHHLCAVIHEVDPAELDHDKQDGVFQKMDECLERIVTAQTYYPFRYQATLTRQSLASMDPHHGVSSKERWYRLFHAMKGVAYFYQALAEVATTKIDVSCFEKGIEEMTVAFARHSIESKEWFEIVQELINFRMLVQKDPEELKNFQDCLERVDEVVDNTKSKEDQLALRYTMIRQVTLLALDCCSKEVRDWAVGEFFNFGTSLAQRKGWAKDVRTLEALLDAMLEIHQIDEFADEMVRVVDRMKLYFRTKEQSDTIVNWLRVTQWKRDVKTTTKSQGKHDDMLFKKIKAELSIDDSLVTSEEVQHELREKYKRESKIPSLFDNEDLRDVHSLHHSLMLHKKEVGNDGQVIVKMTPINLEDLFEDRELTSGKDVEKVKQVLLFGNPGTGKTTIAKKIAYLWSISEWGDQFDVMYLVPVRELVSINYDDLSTRTRRNLHTAITNICFPGKDDDAYVSLRQQVEEDLDKDSTLVIFDGFDEGEVMTRNLIETIESKPCKVLVLSRPRSLQNTKDLANLEVECMGMDEKQLVEFIELETSSIELMEHLRRHPSILEISIIPVIANILTFLYNTKKESVISAGSSFDIFSLYWKMSLKLWERYINKTEINVDRNEIFEALEEIAFCALENGQILIEHDMVHEISYNRQMRLILKDCGFLLLKKEGFFYQFPHLTFQEFFAGQYMAHCLMSKDYERKQQAVDFLEEHKYCSNFRQMLYFMVQACVVKKGDRGFHEVELFIDASPIALGYQQHLVLKLELLEAALSASKHQDRDRILNSTKVLEIALESSKRRIWGNRKFSYNPLASVQYADTFASIIDFADVVNIHAIEVFPKVAKVARYDPGHWEKIIKMLKSLESNRSKILAKSCRDLVVEVVPEEADTIRMLPWEKYKSDDEHASHSTSESDSEVGRLIPNAPDGTEKAYEGSPMDESINLQSTSNTLKNEEDLPDRPSEIVKLLKGGYHARYIDLHTRLFDSIDAFFLSVRERDDVLELIREWSDDDDAVKLELLRRIKVFSRALIDVSLGQLKIAWTLCEDGAHEVRNHARKTLLDFLEYFGRLKNHMHNDLLVLIESEPHSRRSSMAQLFSIRYSLTEGTQEDMNRFFSNLNQEYITTIYNEVVWEDALLGKKSDIIKVHLLHLLCLKTLKPTQIDKNELLKTIEEANAFPDKVVVLSTRLLSIPMCSNRRNAVWRMFLLRFKFPEYWTEIFNTLEQLMEDDNHEVAIQACVSVISILGEEPQKVENTIKRFEELMQLHGCSMFIPLMNRRVSLDELLNVYLECRNELLIPFLVRKLSHTPATMKTMSNGSTRLIVQTSSDSKKTYCFKRSRDAEVFRSIVEKCTERRFQEVAPLIWSRVGKRQNDADNDTPSSSNRPCV